MKWTNKIYESIFQCEAALVGAFVKVYEHWNHLSMELKISERQSNDHAAGEEKDDDDIWPGLSNLRLREKATII